MKGKKEIKIPLCIDPIDKYRNSENDSIHKVQLITIVVFCFIASVLATLIHLKYGIKEITKKVPQIEKKTYYFKEPIDEYNDTLMCYGKRRVYNYYYDLK